MPRPRLQIRWPRNGRLGRTRVLWPCAILIVLLAGTVAVVGLSGAGSAERGIVARVNGYPVTQVDVQHMLADPAVRQQLAWEIGFTNPDSKELDRLAVRKLVERRLLLQEAARENIAVTADDLSQVTSTLRRHFPDAKAFEAWQKERGLDDNILQQALRDDLLLTRVQATLLEGVRLSDEEVPAYYKAHQEELKVPEAIHLRVIAVKDKAAADQIMAGLKKGKDFATVASEQSLLLPEKGGDVGWASPLQLLPALREALATLKVGKTTGPVERGEQFLIARLEDRKAARTLSLAEARPEIERHLLAPKRRAALQAWLAEQKQRSKVETFLDSAGSSAEPAVHDPVAKADD